MVKVIGFGYILAFEKDFLTNDIALGCELNSDPTIARPNPDHQNSKKIKLARAD